jgi:hypothetical protein
MEGSSPASTTLSRDVAKLATFGFSNEPENNRAMKKEEIKEVGLIHGHIRKPFTENTGGGCMVDFFVLGDGTCLGINDECAVLYSEDPSRSDEYPESYCTSYFSEAMMNELYEDFENGDPKPAEVPLTFTRAIKAITHDNIIYYSLIEMDNGGVIIIDDVNICIYENYQRFLDNKVWDIIERV